MVEEARKAEQEVKKAEAEAEEALKAQKTATENVSKSLNSENLKAENI